MKSKVAVVEAKLTLLFHCAKMSGSCLFTIDTKFMFEYMFNKVSFIIQLHSSPKYMHFLKRLELRVRIYLKNLIKEMLLAFHFRPSSLKRDWLQVNSFHIFVWHSLLIIFTWFENSFFIKCLTHCLNFLDIFIMPSSAVRCIFIMFLLFLVNSSLLWVIMFFLKQLFIF